MKSLGLSPPIGSSLRTATLPDKRHAATDTQTNTAIKIVSRKGMALKRQCSSTRLKRAAMLAVNNTHHRGKTEGTVNIETPLSDCYREIIKINNTVCL